MFNMEEMKRIQILPLDLGNHPSIRRDIKIFSYITHLRTRTLKVLHSKGVRDILIQKIIIYLLSTKINDDGLL